MAFNDIEVPVSVKVESAELKRLISEFDGTTESAQRLEAQTLKVKLAIDSQNSAIRTFNQSNRVQNFQTLESLRLLRSFTSTFSSLNQVYQTSILRQISQTQTTVAQNEAFDRISKTTGNVVNALDILGASNDEVDSALSSLISQADSLNSTQLKELIQNYEDAGKKASFTAEEQAKFNEVLEKLKKLLEETKLEEKNKEFQDFFGVFTAAATAAGSLGSFALGLSKFGPQLTSAVSVLSRFAPEITLIIVLLYGKDVAVQLGLLQTAGDGGEDLTNKTNLIEDIGNAMKGKGVEGSPGLGSPSDFFNRLGTPGQAPISINIDNMQLTSDADLYKWSEIVYNKFKVEDSKKIR